MHKRLEADLVSLAHSILQMKNKDDVASLHKKAHAVYEKLSVLKFVDDYLKTTPNATETKEEILSKMEHMLAEPTEDEIPSENVDVEALELSTVEVEEEPTIVENNESAEQVKKAPILQTSLEEELKDKEDELDDLV